MYRDSHTSQGYRVLYLYLSLLSDATKDRRESVGYKILHFHLVKCIWDVFISQSKITTVFQLWNPGFLKMLLSSCISESFFYLTLAWPKVKLNHFSLFLRNCVGYNSGRSKIFSDTTIKYFFRTSTLRLGGGSVTQSTYINYFLCWLIYFCSLNS